MRNIAVLKSRWKQGEEEFFENLKKYALNDTQFTPVYYTDDVKIKMSNEQVEAQLCGKDIKEFDAIYFNTIKKKKDVAIALSKYALTQGIKVIPEYINEGIDYGKLGQTMVCKLSGLPIPKTFFVSTSLLRSSYSEIVDYLGQEKFIMKSSNATKGNFNFLIKSESEFLEAVNSTEKWTPLYICQEFIPNNFDYRILVLGYKAKVCIKRIRVDDSDHRNNVSVGAREEFVNIDQADPDVIKLAEAAAKAMRNDFAGVDIVESLDQKSDFRILEINRSPGLTYDPLISPEVPEVARYLSEE